MNKTNKIALIAMLPIAVLLLSGCGFNSQAPEASKTPTAPTFTTPATESTTPATAETSSTPLPPLPADNTQAIDNEIKGIDQSLQATDAALSSDKTDSELGL